MPNMQKQPKFNVRNTLNIFIMLAHQRFLVFHKFRDRLDLF